MVIKSLGFDVWRISNDVLLKSICHNPPIRTEMTDLNNWSSNIYSYRKSKLCAQPNQKQYRKNTTKIEYPPEI